MKLVILESPFAGDLSTNISYAERCLVDCLMQGEAPFASHLFYPRVLDDSIKPERMKGIVAGFAWMERCDAVVVYTDLGISPGMKLGIERAKELNKPIEYRSLKATDEGD